MPRLIDADALRERMYHDAFETDSYMQKWDSGCWIRYKMFENAVEEAPTVDAKPVNHGHWTKRSKVYPGLPYDHTYHYECSNCGCMDTAGEDVEVPYCWHCGAKMDEVEDAD